MSKNSPDSVPPFLDEHYESSPQAPAKIVEPLPEKTLLERFPGSMSQAAGWARNSFSSIFEANPFFRFGEWMKSAVKEKIGKLLPWLTTPTEKKEQKPSTLSPVAASAASPAPATPPLSESSSPGQAPANTATRFAPAEKLHRDQMDAVLRDFEEINRKLAPSLKARKHDQLAQASLENILVNMRKTGKLDHDHDWLTKQKCAENFLCDNFQTAEEIAEKFMKSPDHRPNLLGHYTEYGLAMERVLAKVPNKETGQVEERWVNMVVVIYKNGSADKAKPVQDNIPSSSHSAAKIDAIPSYLDAIDHELNAAGLTGITHSKNEERTRSDVSEKEIALGSFVETFKTPEGREVHYIVSKTPPLLIRADEKTGIPKEILFEQFLDDFKEALKEQKELDVVGVA